MELHSKEKGALGELVIMKDLLSRGYPVFIEYGDNSRVDLIALVGQRPVKIQVKARKAHKDLVTIDTKKSGPNYSYIYDDGDIDIFALYAFEEDKIAYINSKYLLSKGKRKTMSFRTIPTKNNQEKNVHYMDNYRSFEEALRGHTLPTVTGNADGEEMVQTTTKQ
jgi:hypothetical protein